MIDQRGAATVEKLMVMLLAICFIGAIIAVIGPALAAKYQWAADLLSLGSAPTIAQREALETVKPDSGIGVYVLMFIMGVVVFGGFIAPIMFPRAHRVRSELIQKFARNTGLTRLADISLSKEYSIEELRRMSLSRKQRLNTGHNTSPAAETIGGDGAHAKVMPAPAHAKAMPAPAGMRVATLDGFGGGEDDDEPTHDWGSLPDHVKQQISPDSDVIPFQDVPSVPTDIAHIHAGMASDDETVVRRVTTGSTPVVTAAQAQAHKESDDTDEDKTMLQIPRLDDGVSPDGPTTAHKSLRSRLADRRPKE